MLTLNINWIYGYNNTFHFCPYILRIRNYCRAQLEKIRKRVNNLLKRKEMRKDKDILDSIEKWANSESLSKVQTKEQIGIEKAKEMIRFILRDRRKKVS